jgi:hypothetical protein
MRSPFTTSLLRSTLFAASCCSFALTGCSEETFDIHDNGRSVTYDVGETFDVELTVEVTGQSWGVQTVDELVLKGTESEPEEEAEEGEVPPARFTFECLAAGETQLLLTKKDTLGHLAGSFKLDVECAGEEEEIVEEEESE